MSATAGLFPVYTEDDWRKAATTALKGGSLDKLVSKTSDGVTVGPLHAPAGGPRALKGTAGPWKALARLDHPDPAQANDAALEDLANGADGLQIVFAGAAGAYGYGLARADSATLHRALEGVRFDEGARFELDLGPGGEEEALAVAALIERVGVEPGKVDISFGLDPIGAQMRSGKAARPWDEEVAGLAETVKALRERGFNGPFTAADGRPIHAAGGTPAQELAFAVGSALAYARALVNNGVPDAPALVACRLAADADEFVTLAKFRALRLMWTSIIETTGAPALPPRLHAESAWRMMSVREPYINVMRAGMAAFGAGLGGADSVSLLPFSRAIGLPDSFARRIARNTQLIELRESNLGFVADPAAGAGVFEDLTAHLIEKAWARFQAFEREGGLPAGLRSGAFQREIAEAAAVLKRDAARLKTPLTGVSAHPNIHDETVETAPAERPAFEYPGDSFAPALAPMRVSESFEALRDAVDKLSARPKIFLAAINTPSSNSRRVAFSRDLFETGGFEAVADQGAPNGAECAQRFLASGAEMACLCGSDDDYAAHAEEFARALKGAGVKHLLFAGRAGDKEAAFREAGVDEFVFAGQDAVALLQALIARAGAAV